MIFHAKSSTLSILYLQKIYKKYRNLQKWYKSSPDFAAKSETKVFKNLQKLAKHDGFGKKYFLRAKKNYLKKTCAIHRAERIGSRRLPLEQHSRGTFLPRYLDFFPNARMSGYFLRALKSSGVEAFSSNIAGILR